MWYQPHTHGINLILMISTLHARAPLARSGHWMSAMKISQYLLWRKRSKIGNWPITQLFPSTPLVSHFLPRSKRLDFFYRCHPSHKYVIILSNHFFKLSNSSELWSGNWWGKNPNTFLRQMMAAFFHGLLFHISTTVWWFVQDLEIRI